MQLERLPSSPLLVVACLAQLLAFGCGGAEPKTDPDPVTDPAPDQPPVASQSPDEAALVDIVSWSKQLDGWNNKGAGEYVSEGHENYHVETFVNPEAEAIFDGGGTYPIGAGLALVGNRGPNGEPARTWFMTKMPAETDPDGNDWFYAELDASGAVTLSGTSQDAAVAEACANCHKFGALGTDYVFGVPE